MEQVKIYIQLTVTKDFPCGAQDPHLPHAHTVQEALSFILHYFESFGLWNGAACSAVNVYP